MDYILYPDSHLGGHILLLLSLGIVFMILWDLFVIVNENELVVVERFGKYMGKLEPGIHFLGLSWPRKVNWKFTESERLHSTLGFTIPSNIQVFNPKPYSLRSRENFKVQIDLIVKFRIVDAKAAVYTVDNLYGNFETELRTYMVNLVRKIPMTEITVNGLTEGLNLEALNAKLLSVGMCITTISVEDIRFPEEISESLSEANHKRIDQEAITETLRGEENQARVQADVNRQKQIARNTKRETRHTSKLQRRRESWIAKKEQMTEKHRLELEFQENCAKLLDKYRHWGEHVIELKRVEAWKEIASSPSTRLVFAPTAALNLLKEVEVVKSVKVE